MTGDIKYVSVVGIPFEVPDRVVVEIMSRFGTVKDIKMNFYQQNLQGIANGTRCVKMIVQKDIPSCIKIGNKAINISYSGQLKTCYKCGYSTHIGSECTTEGNERINIWNDENFPLLPDTNIVSNSPLAPVQNEAAIQVTTPINETVPENITENNTTSGSQTETV